MLKQVNELSEYQIEKRASVEKTLQDMLHEPEYDERHVSPCGKYMLLVKRYKHKEKGYWGYTEGVIYKGDEILGSVVRNYSRFMHAWVTGHPDGNDYLVTSENYQGQTIVRLNTGERVDYLSQRGTQGFGWIWASVDPSPCKTLLAVSGCVWGGGYDVCVFDFTEVMKSPPTRLFVGEGDYSDHSEWQDDSTLIYGMEYEHNLVLDKPEYLETEEEWDYMEKLELEGKPYEELYEYRVKDQMTWRRD